MKEAHDLFPKYLLNEFERREAKKTGYFKGHIFLTYLDINPVETDWKNGALQKFPFALTGESDAKFFISSIEIEKTISGQYKVMYTMTRR